MFIHFSKMKGLGSFVHVCRNSGKVCYNIHILGFGMKFSYYEQESKGESSMGTELESNQTSVAMTANPLKGATVYLGPASGEQKRLRQDLINSGMLPSRLDDVEKMERELDLTLLDPSNAYIFCGGGRFEVVSAIEAAMWRQERREVASSVEPVDAEAQTLQAQALVKDALIIGGAEESSYFRFLQSASGVKAHRAVVTAFANGEILPRLGSNTRWKDLYFVSQASPAVNNSLMELLLQLDAAKRGGASRMTAVLPGFPYQRGDRKGEDGTPIPAAWLMRTLQQQGVNQIICCDLHAGQIEGFADLPVENLSMLPLVTKTIGEQYPDERFVVALADEGMAKRLKDDKTRSLIAQNLGEGTTFLQMTKDRIEFNEVNEIHMKDGEINLRGKTVVVLDDMIDTGNTVREAARTLLNAGAGRVIAAATHGIFSGDAIERFRNDRITRGNESIRPISEIFVTDSIPLRRAKGDLVHVVSLAIPLGDVIHSLATKDGRSPKEIMLMHSTREVM